MSILIATEFLQHKKKKVSWENKETVHASMRFIAAGGSVLVVSAVAWMQITVA